MSWSPSYPVSARSSPRDGSGLCRHSLGGPGNILTITHEEGFVRAALADPAAARPDELHAHPAVRGLIATQTGFDLDVGQEHSTCLALSLLASATILPKLT
ncbi:hypothetical protein Q3V23_34690 [Streptomyces sp. VNUA116]|uniref:hypothetical protein n=1 Tax=Streptomyces sp. VNUA116 TaxID=3062449 RepID=UPI0026753919|nr:hypothetical protein [Streptomyces sp. VNUA116]WKU48794.1 hypothetical protein Q3V23_34690 [Streptomyces sp. VNUA116]